MKLYRFSPIESKEDMIKALEYIHFECSKLCKQKLGEYLPISGNIGIFTHYDKEFEFLIKIREELTSDENFNNKYFKLYKPIKIEDKDGIPGGVYHYLYIRKPDPYRHHVGDTDFVLEDEKFQDLKKNLVEGVRNLGREDIDLLELHDPDSDCLGYLTNEMMEDVIKKQNTPSIIKK